MNVLTTQNLPNPAPRGVLGFGRLQLQPLKAAMLALYDARAESGRTPRRAWIAAHTEAPTCA